MAARSAASWKGEAERRRLWAGASVEVGASRFGPRDCCAEASAPKDMEERAAWGSASEGAEED